jgi:hypothetical protein
LPLSSAKNLATLGALLPRASGPKLRPAAHVRDGCPRQSNAPPNASGDESRTATTSAPRAFSRPLAAPGSAGGRLTAACCGDCCHDHRTCCRPRPPTRAERRRRARRARARCRGRPVQRGGRTHCSVHPRRLSATPQPHVLVPAGRFGATTVRTLALAAQRGGTGQI